MSISPRILVVDDELIVRESLSNWLKEDGYDVTAVPDGESGVREVKERTCHIVLLDLKMPGMDGLTALHEMRKIAPDLQIIMMTAYASVDTAVSAMKEGAYDYLVKPFDPEEVSLMIQKILKHQDLVLENILLRQKLEERYEFEDLIGKSNSMQKIFELIRTVAASNATVLITGESGTGKELVARAIHSNSPRRYMPFVALSCGALPETLLESELFGYEKGAFTGADHTKKGRFELADGGTLFLDEIGEVSFKTQIDLLRVLQERSLRRLGGSELIKVDVRIVAATNRDLEAAVREGSFRQDLYYRLNVVSMHLPPLREHREDIPLLASHFLKRFNLEMGKKMEKISPEAVSLMMDYGWPGNVRELENAMERGVVIGPGNEFKAEYLPFSQKSSLSEKRFEAVSLEEIEKNHIQKVLEDNDWNISRSASVLGIDRVTLYNKIKKFSLEKPK